MARTRTWAAVMMAAVVVSGLSSVGAARGADAPRPRVQPVDGGPDYYASFVSSLPADPGFFPLGVWFAGVSDPTDVARDRAVGLNTYVRLTDTSDLSLAAAAGMSVVTDAPPPGDAAAPVAGWLLEDEADMWGGPGWARWTGDTGGEACAPAASPCGYTAMHQLAADAPDDGRLRYSNYGKGVAFWESDDQAAVFVNRFQDVASADTYWFTDPNICGASEGGVLVGGGAALRESACRRASNYGATVDRLRDLVQPAGSRPVWALVEVGHPFTEDWAPTIRPREIRAAVWSSIIHGARGIVYFAHSFGGRCETQHALREPCYRDARAMVAATNQQITELAPVLNSPSVIGVTRTNGHVDTLTKWWRDTYYVFAGARSPDRHRVTLRLGCTGDATVTVLGEHRTLPVVGGTFVDTYADGDAVHLYRIDGGTSCTPR
jgi:hypothetical protein